ncbi:MAG: DUF2249 domain-containing protein [Gemmatimonadetes bacterium]|nr:DUF2249 domain-containing protein [Gemmatimonadota bacterium]NIQ52534.1 DUF2249 domain-containing protein [Gemmatimonadota bacterium]NIU72672.1 DUF2249 domain-containing protein [Gammaproteobacteria bacterium]NIX43078.1 DUF2249 domain-containing protein [Gemmatimonadota bacterium]NIY07238.1 DUF2249 domain-containing protein [Gemmatimonadota bacterium]
MTDDVRERLDVRPVAPSQRYDRIIGVYESLETGQAMELVVDHDPTCMYYTLEATRGRDAFAFDYLDRGPRVWRVRVRKLRDVETRDPFGVAD